MSNKREEREGRDRHVIVWHGVPEKEAFFMHMGRKRSGLHPPLQLQRRKGPAMMIEVVSAPSRSHCWEESCSRSQAATHGMSPSTMPRGTVRSLSLRVLLSRLSQDVVKKRGVGRHAEAHATAMPWCSHGGHGRGMQHGGR